MQNIRYKLLTLFCFFFFFVQSTMAMLPTHLLDRGDSLFVGGKYTEAFDTYEMILQEKQYYSPKMLLRMAYIKEGLNDYTNALYYLNLYYLHSADDEVLQKMSKIAEEQGLQGYQFTDGEYFTSLMNRYFHFMIAGMLLGFILVLSLLVRYRLKGENILAGGIVYTLFLAAFFYLFNYGNTKEAGIIKTNNVYLMDAPSAGANQLDLLTGKGHRVNIVNTKDIWCEVEWEGETAYIRTSNLLLVK